MNIMESRKIIIYAYKLLSGIRALVVFQRKEYVKYAKVFPLTSMLDFKVPSKWYRRVVGSLEIICGLAMATIPSSMY